MGIYENGYYRLWNIMFWYDPVFNNEFSPCVLFIIHYNRNRATCGAQPTIMSVVAKWFNARLVLALVLQ